MESGEMAVSGGGLPVPAAVRKREARAVTSDFVGEGAALC